MRFVALVLCLSVQLARSQSPDAVTALQHGDFGGAEKILRAEVAQKPPNAMTLSLLGAALDSQGKSTEAASFHVRAFALAPRSVDVLNNYAAHLWMSGHEKESTGIYRKVIAIDPSQANANLQLARVAISEGNGADASRLLAHLPAERLNDPAILILRLSAALLAGETSQARELTDRMLEMCRSDADFAYAAGMQLLSARQYVSAERFFEAALKLRPADFNTMYSLGAAANFARHFNRASEVLNAALLQRPDDVNVLYGLAAANESLHRNEAAVALLAKAARLNPARDDVQKLLALTMTELAAFEDALAAWDRYLKLKPADDMARRERASVLASLGRTQEAVSALNQFLLRHPDDAPGWYQLAEAEKASDAAKARKDLDRALAINPAYVPARAARGYLLYQAGKPEIALADLEKIAELKPDDADNLDRLGQTYQALERTVDAVRVLRRAAELLPSDSKILLHLGRALTDGGHPEEAAAVMNRFRQLGPEKKVGVPAGFAKYLAMSEGQRKADYRARVEKAVQDHPADASVRLDQLRLQLEDGETERAADTAKIIVGLKPGSSVLASAGHALVLAHQYGPAVEPLRAAGAGVELDLAIAGSSVADVLAAVQSARMRPELFVQATGWLFDTGHIPEALHTIEQGTAAMPDNRALLLLKAATLQVAGEAEQSDAVLRMITARWPEWYAGWAAQGIVLELRGQFDAAARALQTSLALNPSDTGAKFFLSLAQEHRVVPPDSLMLRRFFEGTLYQ